jgi:phosphoinositide-3-kinase, regulatory subunit 4
MARLDHEPDILTVSSFYRYSALTRVAGNDPNILALLDKFYDDSFFEEGPDFGTPLPLPLTRQPLRLNNNRSHALQNWHPEGTLVAHLTEHQGPINRVIVAADHNFFVTCSDDGTIKIWDTTRLEKNVVNRARLTHRHEKKGVKIKTFCFIDNTHCIASAGDDGSIHLFKVDYSQGTLTPKYGKLKVVKGYQLDEGEYAVWMESYRLGMSSREPIPDMNRTSTVPRCRDKPFPHNIIRPSFYENALLPSESPSPRNTDVFLY